MEPRHFPHSDGIGTLCGELVWKTTPTTKDIMKVECKDCIKCMIVFAKKRLEELNK